MKKINKNDVFLVSETVMLISMLYFLILSIFYKEFFKVVDGITALFLFSMAINAICVKKEKIEGLVYVICGIIVLVIAII